MDRDARFFKFRPAAVRAAAARTNGAGAVARRPVLEALCSSLAPAAPRALAAAVEARIASLEPRLAERLCALIAFFDAPAAGVLAGTLPGRFHRLPAAARERRLHAWERSRVPALRTGFQALRRVVLACWYTEPASWPEIGYLGPLPLRAPAYPWEGPLDAASTAVPNGPPMRAVAPTASTPPVPAAAAPLPVGGLLRADVVVIGSGAGGAVAACRLAEAGLAVAIVEEGGHFGPPEFDGDEARMTHRLYAEHGARATDDLAIPIFQGRAVGGGTTVNWLLMLRPPGWVHDEWEHGHGVSLLGRAELGAALDRVEAETCTRTVDDVEHSPANRVILDGAARLGWRAHAARINAEPCARTGLCGLGCPTGARRGAAAVYLPRAVAAGATLLAGVRADLIERRCGRGFRVRATSLGGAGASHRPGPLTLEADRVVLAAGAVGTPVLLQRSGFGGGAVGRFLRLHPTTAVSGIYDRAMYAAGGIPLSAWCSEFHRGSDGYGFWIECAPLQPALAATALPGFGEPHRSRMKEFPRMANTIVLVRDGADRARSNGDVRVTRRGTRIRYQLGAPERAGLEQGVRAALRLHLAAGAVAGYTLHPGVAPIRDERELAAAPPRDWAPNRASVLSAHVNGTCRMGGNRAHAAVSPDGERYGVPGLFIADGSVLPTAPGVNPQATIMAAADLIARRMLH